MTRRLEAAHRSFTLPSRLVRILCPIVQAPVAAMFDARHDFVMGGFIAPELHPSGVPGDQHPRHVGTAFEYLAEEFPRGCLHPFGVPVPALHQDIKHVAVLIDCPP